MEKGAVIYQFQPSTSQMIDITIFADNSKTNSDCVGCGRSISACLWFDCCSQRALQSGYGLRYHYGHHIGYKFCVQVPGGGHIFEPLLT